jgi:hypothetical protein
MKTPYSLFVKEYTEQSLFGLGIAIPMGVSSPPVRKLTGKYRGWVNGENQHEVIWQDFQELVTPPTHGGKLALAQIYSSSLIRFDMSGATYAIRPPCLIVPYSAGKYTVLQADVAIAIPSLFETAGFQSYHWTVTIANALYGGFLSGTDPLICQAAREARPSTGDAFPVYGDGFAGIVLLGREKEECVFQASLWVLGCEHRVADGLTLLSKDACEIKGLTATFECVFGTVREEKLAPNGFLGHGH